MRKALGVLERDALYLEDIHASATLIAAYIAGTRKQDFVASTTRASEKVDSVSRRLIVIGEAVKALSGATMKALERDHPEIQWRDIAKLKDKLTHHYWTIDVAQIWEIAETHVPILSRAVASLAKR